MNWHETVQPIEVFFLLASLPGMVVWYFNNRQNKMTLRAVESNGLTNGRLIWARFSKRWLTGVGLVVSTLFTAAAILALTRRPSPDSDLGQFVLTGMLTAITLLATLRGFAWRQVNDQILGLAEHNNQARDRTRDAKRDQQRDTERDTVRDVQRDVARDVPRDLQRDQNTSARDGVRDIERDTRRDVDRDVARDGPRDLQRDQADKDRM